MIFDKLYDIDVSYEYIIHDIRYFGNANPGIEYIELSYGDAKIILENKFLPGESIKIYYNPENLKKSYLYYFESWLICHGYELVFGVIILIILIAIILFMVYVLHYDLF